MNEIETILCNVLGCDRRGLYMEAGRKALSGREFNRLESILKKRAGGEPLQYLVGDAEFMGLKIRVSPGVLIPRPETEVLAGAALERMSALQRPLDILDIGTGSGNIAIAIAAGDACGRHNIFAVDISGICLKKARSNARLNRVEDRITFLKSDIFSCFQQQKKVFDLIVSNPPYIAQGDYHRLPPDVKNEPSSALLAGDNGLYFYRKIEEGARRHLAPGGMIFFEVGDGQAHEVKKIFFDASVWCGVDFIKDLCGVDRVVVITRKS